MGYDYYILHELLVTVPEEYVPKELRRFRTFWDTEGIIPEEDFTLRLEYFRTGSWQLESHCLIDENTVNTEKLVYKQYPIEIDGANTNTTWINSSDDEIATYTFVLQQHNIHLDHVTRIINVSRTEDR